MNEQRSKSNESGVEPVQTEYGTNTCLLTTTDIRAPKSKAMLEQQKKYGAAYVEVAWWMEKAQLQVRMRCEQMLGVGPQSDRRPSV